MAIRVFLTRLLWALVFIGLAGCSLAAQGGPSPVTGAFSYFDRTWKFSGSTVPSAGDQIEPDPAWIESGAASIPDRWKQLDDPLVNQRCLEGRWEVVSLEQMITNSAGRSETDLLLTSIEGHVVYAFDGRGEMAIHYEGMVAAFNGLLDGQEMIVEQSYDGVVTSRYTVDLVKNELVLSGFGDGEISTALEINGQRLVDGSLPVWRAFTSAIGGPDSLDASPVVYSIASLACMGDDMLLQSRRPYQGPVVILTRLPE